MPILIDITMSIIQSVWIMNMSHHSWQVITVYHFMTIYDNVNNVTEATVV